MQLEAIGGGVVSYTQRDRCRLNAQDCLGKAKPTDFYEVSISARDTVLKHLCSPPVLVLENLPGSSWTFRDCTVVLSLLHVPAFAPLANCKLHIFLTYLMRSRVAKDGSPCLVFSDMCTTCSLVTFSGIEMLVFS